MTFKSLHQSNDHDWLNGPLHPPHEMLGEEREKKGTNKGGARKKHGEIRNPGEGGGGGGGQAKYTAGESKSKYRPIIR